MTTLTEAPRSTRKKKRLQIVELYRRLPSGRLERRGAVVTEYLSDRRGGSVQGSR